MPDLALIGLNPSAAPVSTFAPAEVRGDAGDARQFADLAGALAQLNGNLSTIAQHESDAVYAGSRERAQLLQAQKRYENQKALKAAVDAGEIKEADNPWFMSQLRAEVDRTDARQRMDEFRNWYETSPEAAAIRQSDSAAPLQSAIDAKLGPVIQGLDVYGAEAVIPELQQFKEHMTSTHLETRRQQRVAERQVSFETLARSTAMSADAPDQVAARLQASMNEASLTLSPLQTAQYTAKAVMDQAEIARDPKKARELLSRLKIPDGSDTTVADAFSPQLTDHESRVENLKVQEMFQQDAIEKKKFNDDRDNLASLLMDSPPEQRLGLIQQLPGKFRIAVANAVTNGIGDERKFNEWAHQDLEQNATDAFIASEAKKISPSDVDHDWKVFALVHDPLKYRELTARAEWPLKTSPEDKLALYDAAQANNGIVPWDTLKSMISSGHIAQDDADYWARLIPATKGKVGDPSKFSGHISQVATVIDDMVKASWLDSGRIGIITDLTTNQEFINRVASLKDEFRAQAEKYLTDNGNKLSYSELDDGLKKIRDTVVGPYGFTYDKWRTWTENNEAAKKFREQSSKGVYFPESALQQVRPGVWSVKGGGGVELTAPIDFPLLFQSLTELNQNGAAVAARLGFTTKKDAKAFRDAQLDLLKLSGKTK